MNPVYLLIEVGAIVFTPLNKTSLHLGGMTEEDELRWFAKELHCDGVTSEINIIPGLWTARVTSHIGIRDVAPLDDQSAALRFVAFIDRAYDAQIPVRATGSPLDEVFTEDMLAGGYRKKYLRAISRLVALTHS